MKPILYFDIGPLQENNYTGVPAVTAAFAEHLLSDQEVDGRFLWDRFEVPAAVVRELLNIRDGRFFCFHMRTGSHKCGMLTSRKVGPDAIGLFPNMKGARGLFRREAQIVHDFSTLLFPETHHNDTINHHALAFRKDLESNEFTFCVSDATRADLLSYFEVDPATVHTAHLGVADPFMPPSDMPVICESYIAVLGTLEPRKNIRLVLQLLEKSPEWATRYRFVFIGRHGWGKTIDEVLDEYPQVHSLYQNGRLVFTGYVDDASKQVLLRNAQVLIFPSLFEGFGLPVLEAMELGTPVVCSYSSSIPEVAGDAGFYFDPYSVDSLELALLKFEDVVLTGSERLTNRLLEQAASFRWDKFYRSIRDVLFPSAA